MFPQESERQFGERELCGHRPARAGADAAAGERPFEIQPGVGHVAAPLSAVRPLFSFPPLQKNRSLFSSCCLKSRTSAPHLLCWSPAGVGCSTADTSLTKASTVTQPSRSYPRGWKERSPLKSTRTQHTAPGYRYAVIPARC